MCTISLFCSPNHNTEHRQHRNHRHHHLLPVGAQELRTQHHSPRPPQFCLMPCTPLSDFKPLLRACCFSKTLLYTAHGQPPPGCPSLYRFSSLKTTDDVAGAEEEERGARLCLSPSFAPSPSPHTYTYSCLAPYCYRLQKHIDAK